MRFPGRVNFLPVRRGYLQKGAALAILQAEGGIGLAAKVLNWMAFKPIEQGFSHAPQ